MSQDLVNKVCQMASTASLFSNEWSTNVNLPSSPRTFALLCLTLLVGCGPADDNNSSGDNSTNANNSGGDNNGGSGSVIELLPDGYDRAEAGRFSPDGTRLAMMATPPGDGAEAEIITTDLTGGDIEVVVTGGLSYLTTIAWMPDGESLVYAGNDGIMQVGLDGSDPVLLVDAFAVESVDVSTDGALVTWSVNGGTTITTAPVSGDPASTEEHIAGPTGDMPRFGADGRIAYVWSDGVAVSEPNGDEAQTFEAATNFFSNVVWLDGETLATTTEFGVTSVDLNTGETTDLAEQFAALALDVSPDGSKWVLTVNGQKSLRLGSF